MVRRASSNAVLGDKPAWTVRDAQQHQKKQDGGKSGDAKLPSPFCRAEMMSELTRRLEK